MSKSFEVLTAALNSHARTLTTLAGELRAALDTARSVAITGDAYGQAGERFTTAIADLVKVGHTALASEVAALESAGTSVRATAEAYDRSETEQAALLAGIGNELDR